MDCMSEAFASDCQVNVRMDKTSLLAANEEESVNHSRVNRQSE